MQRPDSWRPVKLESVCEYVTVGHVGPMADEYTDEGVPFLRSQNIQPFHLDLSEVKYIGSDFHQKLKKSELRPGDVAIVRTGYPGTACVIPQELAVANCADLVIVRPSDELDGRFLAALFNSAWGRGRISGSLVGVAQQHFNVGVAKQMEIHLPPRSIQRWIGDVLGRYSDLIENNTRRIKVLEEMAHSIYREWFVNFRFPGHEDVEMVESKLGPIPEGWGARPIGDELGTLGGGTPSTKEEEYWTDGEITWFTPSDLTAADQMFISESSRSINALGLTKSSAKLFPPHSVMMTSRATVGVVSINTTEACTNQGFITAIPNDRVSAYQVYFWVKENRPRILKRASGATFREINKTNFRSLPIIIPPLEVGSRFEALVGPIGKLIRNLQRQLSILRETRDLLLPKLISGEIPLEDIDSTLEEAVA